MINAHFFFPFTNIITIIFSIYTDAILEVFQTRFFPRSLFVLGMCVEKENL